MKMNVKVAVYFACAAIFGSAYGLWSIFAFRWFRGSAWLPLFLGGAALIYMVVVLTICQLASRAVDNKWS
jgi:hypothetical protein